MTFAGALSPPCSPPTGSPPTPDPAIRRASDIMVKSVEKAANLMVDPKEGSVP